jgi:CheY-like chemotaxis protein
VQWDDSWVSARVLCVDDEPLIRMMLADAIIEMGLWPVEAVNGEEALEMLDGGEVDLLITDIRMGNVSGWEVAEHARAKQPDLPIIYISGFPSAGKPLPGTIYMAKPFRPQELASAVRRSLGLPAAA